MATDFRVRDLIAGNAILQDSNNQLCFKTGVSGNSIFLTAPSITATRTYTIPDVGSSAAFVLTAGSQTIAGNKTFSNNIIGNGTANLFTNESGVSPHSLLTQQQKMLNGHKFRQLVNVNQKTVGVNANTTAGAFQVLGMKASIGAIASHSAATYTFDSLYCTDVSTAVIPVNNEIDVFFHGVALRFQPDVNWVARINFGIAFARTVPFADSPATSADRQWGVEFYYSAGQFYGRLYYYFDGPIVQGTPFVLPLYTGATYVAWPGFIYSIRMRQVVIGTRTLRFEFYINDSTSNAGGTALSKTTATATLDTTSISIASYSLSGKHVNFEVASSSVAAPSNVVSMQCAHIQCQFKS